MNLQLVVVHQEIFCSWLLSLRVYIVFFILS